MAIMRGSFASPPGAPIATHPRRCVGDTCCPLTRPAQFPGQRVIVCGLIVEERLQCRNTGEITKFINLCDYTGFVECEIFAETYRRWGLATVRWPVVEVAVRAAARKRRRGIDSLKTPASLNALTFRSLLILCLNGCFQVRNPAL